MLRRRTRWPRTPSKPPLKSPKQSIQSLFTEQSAFLDQFFQTLDFEETAKFCQKVLDCKGTTLFTGIGKSSYIAKKVCQTLVSTGTRAIHLAPVDALHGDIGNVNEGDIVVLFSKSGTTEELVNLVPYAKAKGGFLVAATANKESQLAKLCDMHVTIPAPGELQPFEKGSSSVGTSESRVSPPVTYTALQMMFGDTCAVYIQAGERLDAGRVRDESSRGENWEAIGVEGAGRDEED